MFGYVEVGLHGGIGEIKQNFVKCSQLCLPLWLFPSTVNFATVITFNFNM